MIITRETDYALRILRRLSDSTKCTISSICAKDAVPKQFAYKIIGKLSKAGVVENIRGNGGGCVLVADLKNMSLLDLLRIMDEDWQVNVCTGGAYRCSWEEECSEKCMIRPSLAAIQKSIEEKLSEPSIYFLIKGEK